MPPAEEADYVALVNDSAAIVALLFLFERLYAHGEEREVIERTAPETFSMIRRMIFRELVIMISAITDSPTTGGGKRVKHNLTLKAFLTHYTVASHPTLYPRLNRLLDGVKKYSDRIRKIRNKKIAHYDHQARLGPPMPEERSMLKDAQRAAEYIQRFLWEIEIHYRGAQRWHSHRFLEPRDVNEIGKRFRMAEKWIARERSDETGPGASPVSSK